MCAGSSPAGGTMHTQAAPVLEHFREFRPRIEPQPLLARVHVHAAGQDAARLTALFDRHAFPDWPDRHEPLARNHDRIWSGPVAGASPPRSPQGARATALRASSPRGTRSCSAASSTPGACGVRGHLMRGFAVLPARSRTASWAQRSSRRSAGDSACADARPEHRLGESPNRGKSAAARRNTPSASATLRHMTMRTSLPTPDVCAARALIL